MNKKNENQKPVDLSEYAEEKIPFDTVIRRIAKAKPVHHIPSKPKSEKDKPKSK